MNNIIKYNLEEVGVNINGEVKVRNIPRKKMKLSKEESKLFKRFLAVSLAVVAAVAIIANRAIDNKPQDIAQTQSSTEVENPLYAKINEYNKIIAQLELQNVTYKTYAGETYRQVAEDIVPYPSQILDTINPEDRDQILAIVEELYNQCIRRIHELNNLGQNDFLPDGEIRVPNTNYFQYYFAREVTKMQLNKQLQASDTTAKSKVH